MLRSSYSLNNLGVIFTQTVILNKPWTIVDLGLLDGYSLFYLALGVQYINQKQGQTAHVVGYDLFDGYEYKHGSLQSIATLLKQSRLDEFATVKEGDAYAVSYDYAKESVDLLHIDISNDGDKVLRLLELWTPKIRNSGIILIEGGSEERDHVEWMKIFDKPPIRPVLLDTPFIQNAFYPPFIYEQFPSLTVLQKKVQ